MLFSGGKKKKKSFEKICQEQYLVFLDRSEIDIDFTYDDGEYILTGLVTPDKRDIVIRYEDKAGLKVGYEGRVDVYDKHAFANLFMNAESRELEGFILDAEGTKPVVANLNKEYGQSCFDYLEEEFNTLMLSREVSPSNKDLLF